MMKSALSFASRRTRFERLIRPWLHPLYRRAYRLTGDRDEAEDLVQDLLASLYQKGIRLEEVEDLERWLLKSLYHQFIDRLRRAGRSPLGHLEADTPDGMDRLEDAAPSPEVLTEQQLEIRRVQAALDALNPHFRAVLVLHDVEGFTLQELSPVLDAPLGTLKSRLHRARRALRDRLRREPSSGTERVIMRRRMK